MALHDPETAREAPSPSWCALPWLHLFVGETGTMRPCCMALEEPAQVNRDAAGEPYLIYAGAGVDEAWNSPFMRGLRTDMLAGKRPAACQRCFREEDLGVTSHRTYSNRTFAAQTDAVLAQTDAAGAVPLAAIRSLDIRLGNRCNLKCRMCSPVSSRALLPDFASYYDLAKDDPRLLALVGEDWVDSPRFRDAFTQASAGIEKLLFAGGEPLLVPAMEHLLQDLIARGIAGGIDLEYVTNLTVLPDRLFALWARFRRVSFVVSVDGIGAVGEVIRHPQRWPRLDQNLRRLDAALAQLGGASLHVNMTVQAYNVGRVAEVVDYVAATLPHFGRPKLSLLFYPEHLSVRVLPAPLKARAAADLRALAARIGAGTGPWSAEDRADLVAMIAGIIDYMLGEDRSDLLPDFQRWTRQLDASRREDTLAAIPELAGAL